VESVLHVVKQFLLVLEVLVLFFFYLDLDHGLELAHKLFSGDLTRLVFLHFVE